MRGMAPAAALLVVSVLCTAWSAAQPAKKPEPKAFTNADVVKMVQAGLGEALVVAAIRQAKRTAFDVSPEALMELKAAGVGETILAAMLDPAGAHTPDPRLSSTPEVAVAAPASPPAGDPNDRRASHPPGIYIDLGETAPKLVALEPTVFSQGKSGGMFASAMTFGLAKAKWKAIVRGARAQLRTTLQQPSFYFYFEEKGSGLSSTGGFGGWLAGASSPNEFVLVQMYEKSDRRELVVGEFNVFGSSAGTRSEDTVPVKIEKLAPGIYRVTPTEALGRGEFCFFYAAGGATFGGGTLGKLFDFGVDVPGTASPR